jgi:hypothetical protein
VTTTKLKEREVEMPDDVRIEMKTALGIGGPVTQVTKARGGRVYELGHVEGRPQVPSVTSIVDGTMRNYGLEIWRQQHIERGLEAHRGKALSRRAIDKIMTASLNEARASADLGTQMHSIIECMLRGEGVTVPEQLEPAVEGWLKWRAKHASWLLQGTEVTVYDEALGYAGTVDALWFDPSLQAYIVVDWKTSSGIYQSALMQVAAYAHALKKMLFDAGRLGITTRVLGMAVRLDNDYPRINGTKDRSQPKVFTPKVEYAYAWGIPDRLYGSEVVDGWLAFERCLALSQASKGRIIKERL